MDKVIFLFFLVLLHFTKAHSQVISDPAWEVMIKSSDLIVHAEILRSTNYDASLKIEDVIKGEIEGKEIQITGFSERGGKTNYLKVGDEYIFFLKNVEDKFKVWSPTAGFLKIDKNEIKYDLFYTTHHVLQNSESLKFFKEFLYACLNEDLKPKFQEKLMSLIEEKILYDIAAQYILMLKISGYREYNDILFEAVFNENENIRIALARYLGGLEGVKARENLVSLLSSDELIVAEEAAIQLANFKEEIVGEALLRRLNRTQKNESYLSDNGTLNQLQMKIIKSLIVVEYYSAGNEISSILATNNKSTFEFGLNACMKLKSTNYNSYFVEHFAQNGSVLFDTILNSIFKYRLSESTPILTDFISKLDKSKPDYSELLESEKLEIFLDSNIRKFVVQDFNKSIQNNLNKAWFDSYMNFFTSDSIGEVKDTLYNYVGIKTGIQFDSLQTNEVFEIDSVKKDVASFGYLELFLNYLVSAGTVNDVIILRKMEVEYNFTEPQKAIIEEYLQKLEKRFNL